MTPTRARLHHGITRRSFVAGALGLVALTGPGLARVAAQDDAAGPDAPPAMLLGGPAHSSEQPGPGPEIAEGADPVARWKFATGGPVRTSPAVAGGTAFFGSNDGFLYAVELETGEQVWRYETAAELRSSPAVVDGVVFAGAKDGDVIALDAATGDLRWRFPTAQGIVAAPTVSDGVVYASTNDQIMYAIDAATGQERWHGGLASPTLTSPTLSNTAIFVGNEDGVFAADRRVGESIWPRAEVTGANLRIAEMLGDETTYRVDAPLALDGGVVYSVGLVEEGKPGDDVYKTGGALFAIQATTGDVLWAYVFQEDSPLPGAPVVAEGVVYVGGNRGALYAVSARGGTESWAFAPGTAPFAGGAAIVGGVVYAGNDDRNLYAIDAATGARRWSFATAAPVRSAPAVVDGVVYVGSDDGHLYAIGAG